MAPYLSLPFHRCARAAASAVLVLGFVQAAGAQEAKDPWATASEKVALGEPVIFEVAGSPRQTGLLQSITPEGLTVMVAGEPVKFRRGDVNKLWKKGDSKLNGFLIGAGITAVGLGTLFGVDCSDGNCDGGSAAAWIVLYSGLGGLVGLGVDALIEGKTLVYKRPAGVAFAPIVAPDRVGVQARLAW